MLVFPLLLKEVRRSGVQSRRVLLVITGGLFGTVLGLFGAVLGLVGLGDEAVGGSSGGHGLLARVALLDGHGVEGLVVEGGALGE